MKPRITLTADEAAIQKAKSYAGQTGQSVSGLNQRYLEALTEEHREPRDLSSKLLKLVGAVKLPADFDEKRELEAYFENKF